MVLKGPSADPFKTLQRPFRDPFRDPFRNPSGVWGFCSRNEKSLDPVAFAPAQGTGNWKRNRPFKKAPFSGRIARTKNRNLRWPGRFAMRIGAIRANRFEEKSENSRRLWLFPGSVRGFSGKTPGKSRENCWKNFPEIWAPGKANLPGTLGRHCRPGPCPHLPCGVFF